MSRSLKVLLWIAVIASLICLGGMLFDLVVVSTAWGADPPESLKLMPYGPRYPHNPGDFGIPASILILVSYFGALIAGRKGSSTVKVLLIVPVVLVVIGAVATPTMFWPMITDLYRAGIGRITLSDAELTSLVRRWFVLDTLRALLLVGGLVCHIILLNRKSESDPE